MLVSVFFLFPMDFLCFFSTIIASPIRVPILSVRTNDIARRYRLSLSLMEKVLCAAARDL